MLSAVAARKAKALQSSPTSAPQHISEDSPDATPTPDSIKAKPISKRAASGTGRTPERNKKRKKSVALSNERHTRLADNSPADQDVIVIEPDEIGADAALEADATSEGPISPRDSSDEGMDAAEKAIIEGYRASTNTNVPQPHLLSTFRPAPSQNYLDLTGAWLNVLGLPQGIDSIYGRHSTLVSLQKDERLCFVGSYALTVLRGSVSICGVTLMPSRSPHSVFAPRSAPLPVITAVSHIPRTLDLDLESLDSSVEHLPSRDGAVVLISSLRTGIEGLGRVCGTFSDMFEPLSRGEGDPMNISSAHFVRRETRSEHPFIVNSSWEAAFSATITAGDPDDTSVNSALICLVCGAKKTGKSTFARTLVNRLLQRYQRVAFLETDVGQPEFTPPGMVALTIVGKPVFGPAFTHFTVPHRAHFVGATTPRSSPAHYLDAVHDLAQTYSLDIQFSPPPDDPPSDDTRIRDAVPLVVNTMGWTKGLGADLVDNMRTILTPTHVFSFGDTDAGPTDEQLGADPPFFQQLDPIVSPNPYTAADHRALAILSYLHSAPLGGLPSWRTDLPLCALPPYEVSVRVALDRVVLTGAGSEDVVRSEIARVLNGALVGLVACDPGSLDDVPSAPSESESDATAIPYTQGTPPPAPARSTCLGLGLVRSLYTATTATPSLHLLTPVPPSLLDRVRVLVKGELELPVWGFLDFTGAHVDERKGAPFLRWGRVDGAGAERRRVRRNLMRKGQM